MPFLIVRNDITRMRVDAIVNAAKPSLLGGGGVDGAIHAAAGPELLEECRGLGGCEVGQAKLTSAYRLPCRWVIHTVGPRWHGGLFGEKKKLQSCYRSALALAAEQGCESVAFPLISSGAYGYPKDKAMEAARECIEEFLQEQEMTVYLVLYGDESMAASRRYFSEIREYIDSNYAQAHPGRPNRPDPDREWARESIIHPGASLARPQAASAPARKDWDAFPAPAPQAVPAPRPAAQAMPQTFQGKLDEDEETGWIFGELDESFQQMLLRKIDERGMTDAECYKKANIDRKLFSKIRKDVQYKPSKPTACAFAVALKLDLPETRELLSKAGFALSRSSRFDLIVQYYIERKKYNIYVINETLFAFDLPLLGNAV